MPSLLERIDTVAGRLTNRLIQRLPGPQIDASTRGPIVSFTFDDVPETALTAGAAILERYDARGTFYISGGLTGRHETDRRLITAGGCAELVQRGHELGCHSFAHPNIRHLRRDALTRDLAQNRAFLDAIAPVPQQRNFAYPFTAASFRSRTLLAQHYRSARGGLYGVNRGLTNRTYLRAMPIEQPERSVLALRQAVDGLIADPGWLIFYGHDVANTPTPFGCTPQSFETLVAHVRASGCAILTVDAALDRLGGGG